MNCCRRQASHDADRIKTAYDDLAEHMKSGKPVALNVSTVKCRAMQWQVIRDDVGKQCVRVIHKSKTATVYETGEGQAMKVSGDDDDLIMNEAAIYNLIYEADEVIRRSARLHESDPTPASDVFVQICGFFAPNVDIPRFAISMELANMLSLDSVMQHRHLIDPTLSLTRSELKLFLPDISAALEFLSRINIVHHNVIPGNILCFSDEALFYVRNILVSRVGRFKLADFSLAKALTSRPGMTFEVSRVGHEVYMAPEVYCSRPDLRLGCEEYKKVDIYSTGIVVMHILGSLIYDVDEYMMSKYTGRCIVVPLLEDKVFILNTQIKKTVASIHPLLERIVDKRPHVRPTAAQFAAEVKSVTCKW